MRKPSVVSPDHAHLDNSKILEEDAYGGTGFSEKNPI